MLLIYVWKNERKELVVKHEVALSQGLRSLLMVENRRLGLLEPD